MTLTPSFRAEIAAVARELVERMRERAAVKTLEQYTRQLRQYAREYYTGKLDDGSFLDRMINAVSGQFQRAWYEGMRENGLDPKQDMTDEWRARLDLLIEQEQGFITNLADLINDQRSKDAGMDAIYSRVDVWASNYPAITQIAVVETRQQMLVWHLGATEIHCSSCSALDGLVKPAQEWEDRGYYPRVNGADYLECRGYNCDCTLEPTDEKESKRDFPQLP